MKFAIFQQSRLGQRKINQDRALYRYTQEALLLVIADGMGGHVAGEVAAQVATGHIAAAFGKSASPRLDQPFLFLSQALAGAHQAILDTARRDQLPESPRTTCVICVIQDGAAYWAHSGDSRLYLLRRGEVLTRTRDHSRVQFLIDQGVISEEEAEHHPERNRVLSCLGGALPPQVACSRKMPLETGDIIALCTDGAWGPLSGRQFADMLADANVTRSVPALLDAAEAQAGEHGDNATMVAVCWQSAAGANSAAITGVDTSERKPAPDVVSDEQIENAVAQIRARTPHQPG